MAHKKTSDSIYLKPGFFPNEEVRNNLNNMRKRIKNYQVLLFPNKNYQNYGKKAEEIEKIAEEVIKDIIVIGYLRDLNEVSKVFIDHSIQYGNYFFDVFSDFAEDEAEMIRRKHPKQFKKFLEIEKKKEQSGKLNKKAQNNLNNREPPYYKFDYNKEAQNNLNNMIKRIKIYQEILFSNKNYQNYDWRADKISEIIITGYLRDLDEVSKVFADIMLPNRRPSWNTFKKFAQDEIDIIKNELPNYFEKYNKLNNMEKIIKSITPKRIRSPKRLPEKLNKGGDIHKHFQKIRKHQGIHQSGGKKGKLKKGYKYSGKKTKTGLSIIVKVSK